MAPDGKGCVDRDECLDLPCLNGAQCLNLEPRLRYRCECPDGFWGENCELIQEGQTLKLSMGALAAILVCLLIILSEHNSCSFLCAPTAINEYAINRKIYVFLFIFVFNYIHCHNSAPIIIFICMIYPLYSLNCH